MIRIAMVEDEAAVREQLMGYVQRYTRQYGHLPQAVPYRPDAQ